MFKTIATLVLPVLALSLASCSEQATEIRKPSGKADSNQKLCKLAGEPDDCDVCEVQGWYGDGECDDFCDMADPDCPVEPDPFANRQPNPACDPLLDVWMFDCIDLQINFSGHSLDDAIDECIGGAEDGEPLELSGVCFDEVADETDLDCLFALSDNAEECGTAIGEEFRQVLRQPNPACDARLDAWMYGCITRNVAEGESLEDATSFCEAGALDGEPLEINEVCDSGDEDCLIDLADNAEDCAAAIASELQ